MEYYIKQLGPTHFSVAKFAGCLDDVYEIYRKKCSCPSPKLPCKHVLMISKWLKLDTPEEYYFDTAVGEGEFVKYPPFIRNFAELIGKAVESGLAIDIPETDLEHAKGLAKELDKEGS